MNDTRLGVEEIANRVHFHAPSDKGAETHALLSVVFEEAMKHVDELCPASREKSLAFTKLEEAKMWASAAVARNPETR